MTKVLLLVPLLEGTDALKYPYVEDRALVLLERSIIMYKVKLKYGTAILPNKKSYKSFMKSLKSGDWSNWKSSDIQPVQPVQPVQQLLRRKVSY